MAKSRGNRANIKPVDEVIPEEVKEEVLEAVVTEPITVEEETKKPIYTIKQAGEVIAFRLNIRERPSEDSNIVKVICLKDELEILDESTANGWVPVLLNDGTKGYCMSEFIKFN